VCLPRTAGTPSRRCQRVWCLASPFGGKNVSICHCTFAVVCLCICGKFVGSPMARIVRNSKLDTRSARAETLSQRRAPYWHPISPGFALGYRKAPKGGVWLAKLVKSRLLRRETTLGPADDALDPDGVH